MLSFSKLSIEQKKNIYKRWLLSSLLKASRLWSRGLMTETSDEKRPDYLGQECYISNTRSEEEDEGESK